MDKYLFKEVFHAIEEKEEKPGRWRTRKERRACEKMRKSISMKFGQMLVPCMGSIHKHFDDGKVVPF